MCAERRDDLGAMTVLDHQLHDVVRAHPRVSLLEPRRTSEHDSRGGDQDDADRNLRHHEHVADA